MLEIKFSMRLMLCDNRYAWDAPFGGAGNAPALVFVMIYCKGVFSAPMSFREFPMDDQRLPVQFYFTHPPETVMRSMVKITPYAALSPQIMEQQMDSSAGDTLSGWDVVSATANEIPFVTFDLHQVGDVARSNGRTSFSLGFSNACRFWGVAKD